MNIFIRYDRDVTAVFSLGAVREHVVLVPLLWNQQGLFVQPGKNMDSAGIFVTGRVIHLLSDQHVIRCPPPVKPSADMLTPGVNQIKTTVCGESIIQEKSPAIFGIHGVFGVIGKQTPLNDDR
jgi:hypothetical protein